MTSIHKTAYPYYSTKKKIPEEILATDYRLTRAELSMMRKSSRDINSQLSYAVLLIVFKNLGYFPESTTIPSEIIDDIKKQLQIPTAEFNTHASTISKYRLLVYDYLKTKRWKKIKSKNAKGFTNPAEKFALKVALN
ncbi:MAG: DUF4158 domain-containing protein [Gammaproteobacteria bacterium]|jgi:hypothetical protein